MQRDIDREERSHRKVNTLIYHHLTYRLATELLAKETLALPDIVDILGQRPYPLKDTVVEYLKELRQRKVTDTEESEAKKEGEEVKAE